MYGKRPVKKLSYSTFEKILQIISGVIVILSFLLISIYWSKLPNKIPTHYDALGSPDAQGQKDSIFILPVISLILYIVLSLLIRIPHVYNYIVEITKENVEYQYRNSRRLLICLKTELVCIFMYILWKTILISLGRSQGLGAIFTPVSLIIIFGTLLYFIIKSIRFRHKS